METENTDLFKLIEKVWMRRKVVVLWIGIFLVMGGVLYLLAPRHYRADSLLQWNLLDGNEGSEAEIIGQLPQVSPVLYPEIFYSDAFMQRLIHRPLYVDGTGDTVTYYSSLVGRRALADSGRLGGCVSLSDEERGCIGRLKGEASLIMDANERLLTIEVESEDPKMAASLATQAQRLFRRYVCEEGHKKARMAFESIEKRYLKMKEDLALRQEQLIADLEKCGKLPSVRASVEKKILMDDYELFYSLYSEQVRRYEMSRILFREDMSVLTVIRPAVEPTAPSKPRPRLILLASLFLGFLMGCGWALLVPQRRR